MSKMLKSLISLFIIIIIIFCIYEFQISKVNARNERREKAQRGEIIVFLGDSITERNKTDKYFKSSYIVNSGVGGNTTDDVLSDMNNRVYQHKPYKVFLLIGINDILFTDKTDEEIVSNIQKIVNNIQDNTKSKIYIESILPINPNMNKDFSIESNKRIVKINKSLLKMCNNDNIVYINTHDLLLDRYGYLNKMYTRDGIHPNKLGYFIINGKLYKKVNEL